jgi:hypothetical protein
MDDLLVHFAAVDAYQIVVPLGDSSPIAWRGSIARVAVVALTESGFCETRFLERPALEGRLLEARTLERRSLPEGPSALVRWSRGKGRVAVTVPLTVTWSVTETLSAALIVARSIVAFSVVASIL